MRARTNMSVALDFQALSHVLGNAIKASLIFRFSFLFVATFPNSKVLHK